MRPLTYGGVGQTNAVAFTPACLYVITIDHVQVTVAVLLGRFSIKGISNLKQIKYV